MPFKNKAEQREYQRQWIAARLASFFEGKKCLHCGSTTALELDHIDPTQKISHRIWSWSLERQAKEIAKCRILCRPCHQAVTPEAQPKYCHEHKVYGRRRCIECRRRQKREYMRRVRVSDPTRWR